MKMRLLTLLCACASASAAGDATPDFPAWLTQFRLEAQAQGISPATLNAALGEVRPLPEVLDRDRRQPEFFEPFLIYLDKRLSHQRLERGQAEMLRHKALLEEVQAQYGVPPGILVAFWGLESNYGSQLGGYPVPAALATLAFDARRSAFFRAELLQALRLIEAGDVAAADMKGSWAGAMGQVQFMPSTYLHYAVDGDGDGRRNLWTSPPDVLHSAAHFLRELGWKPGEDWGLEVRLPAGFDWETARLGERKRLKEWAELGLLRADGSPLTDIGRLAAIVLPQGHTGPAFLVFHNFGVILGWNRSIHYALTVGLLSNRLQGLPGLLGGRGADGRSMTREQVLEIQRLLVMRGLYSGEPDGLPGSRTSLAIRVWQKAAGLPADGYACMDLLERLRQAQ